MLLQYLLFCLLLYCDAVIISHYVNFTLEPDTLQLPEFRERHPLPIGLLTSSAGEPVDLRDMVTLNTEVFNRQFHLETILHLDGERTPERVVHAKGIGAYGYFEVTNDVSEYTKADVFNGVGKKTPVFARFSTQIASLGGNDVERTTKSIAAKFYTKEGNLDFLGIHIPIFAFNDPVLFTSFARATRRNPRTGIPDPTLLWDLVVMRPELMHIILWLQSDVGIPNGYRKMDNFLIHPYEINNAKGETFYVKFNFRSELGLDNLTSTEAQIITGETLDYYNRDLYNAIAEKNYPSWRIEMDVMTMEDLKTVEYNPFDHTVLWKPGTYHTVPIGRMVLNRHVENHFKDSEQSAFNPANLVPGIPGPIDFLFKARRVSYLDTQNYRLSRNHNNILVNKPKFAMTYTRDARPPNSHNMMDVPNYFPNSYSGPAPLVDETKPKQIILPLTSQAVDLGETNNFYNVVVESDAHRQRIADNIAATLLTVNAMTLKNVIWLLTLTDPDLGHRTKMSLKEQRSARATHREDRMERIAECIARFS
ncbi:hypothetical protein K1T71_001129 [Dendrolimus kikuchii]|uniref:Uncharacterized protein n=1 Tax=Dendrolimus kikuchii TaxID=765133 RepID=A0ACC1DGR4_9NEOP|nr:hypothetical protein K1T71_001129 [Dendrolimus kikuchii]